MAKNDYNKIEKDDVLFQKFLKNFVIQTLRRATYRWPYKNIARTNSRIERAFYECSSCKGAFGPKDINLDHVQPVIDVERGFTDWNDFINRLFVKTEGFQVLCETCHTNKTNVENLMRQKYGQKPIKTRKKAKKDLTEKKNKSTIK